MPIRVVIVEDDEDLRDSLHHYLTRVGMDVRSLGDAESLAGTIAAAPADILVLDINLPREDGFMAAARVRAVSSMGIIMLTGRDPLEDRLLGLSVGADHYLLKPANPAELELVIRNLYRRVGPAGNAGAASERWVYDSGQWTLTAPTGANVVLSAVERHIVERLARQPGQPVERSDLLPAINRAAPDASSRGLDTIIFRLRRKVERECRHPLPILSVRGIGYVFAAPIEVCSTESQVRSIRSRE